MLHNSNLDDWPVLETRILPWEVKNVETYPLGSILQLLACLHVSRAIKCEELMCSLPLAIQVTFENSNCGVQQRMHDFSCVHTIPLIS